MANMTETFMNAEIWHPCAKVRIFSLNQSDFQIVTSLHRFTGICYQSS